MMRGNASTDRSDVSSMIRFEAFKWTGEREEADSDDGHPSAVHGGRESCSVGSVRRVEDSPMAVSDLARSEEPSEGEDLLGTKRARELSHQQVVEQVAQERASRMLDRATYTPNPTPYTLKSQPSSLNSQP